MISTEEYNNINIGDIIHTNDFIILHNKARMIMSKIVEYNFRHPDGAISFIAISINDDKMPIHTTEIIEKIITKEEICKECIVKSTCSIQTHILQCYLTSKKSTLLNQHKGMV